MLSRCLDQFGFLARLLPSFFILLFISLSIIVLQHHFKSTTYHLRFVTKSIKKSVFLKIARFLNYLLNSTYKFWNQQFRHLFALSDKLFKQHFAASTVFDFFLHKNRKIKIKNNLATTTLLQNTSPFFHKIDQSFTLVILLPISFLFSIWRFYLKFCKR